MPGFLAVLRSQVCLNKVPCHCWTDGPAAHTDYVHVIVFDSLLCGEMIVDEPGASARHLVGTHRRANPTAANSHASIHLAGRNGMREKHHEVGIIVIRVQAIGSEVLHLVPSLIKFGHDFFFKRETTMIGSNSNPHAISLSPSLLRSPAAALSASSTALFCSTRPAGID